MQSLKAVAAVPPEISWRVRIPGQYLSACALVLAIFVPFTDTRPVNPEILYEQAHQLFLHGDLIETQREAAEGYSRYLKSNGDLASKFLLLEARAQIWRGLNEDALRTLSSKALLAANPESAAESATLKGVANTYLGRFDEAGRQLTEAESLCRPANAYAACDDLPIAKGVLAVEHGNRTEARALFLSGLSTARTHQNRRAETSALLNLGVTALRAEHYDDAVDWSMAAYRIAVASGSDARAENILGNLGWTYYKLGDKEKALELSLAAEKSAEKLGIVRDEIKWLANAGLIYQERGESARAVEVYKRSLDLAKGIASREDVAISLVDLTYLSIESGDLEAANAYMEQVDPLIRESGNREDELDLMFAKGEIAAARHQDQQAEALFRTVEHDPASQTSMRLGAEHQLARLYETQGNAAGAEEMYRTALTTFEAARADLKNEESKLPFLANATPIYDDYIRFLVKQGRSDEALAAADQSRARTLAQGLDVSSGKAQMKPAAFRATDVARKSGSSVLFYWLGEKESYLWAITAKKTSLYTLPAQRAIAPLIERYRQELLQPAVARQAAEADGAALFRMLVAPAESAIPPGGNVVVVCDGALSLLNFETLLAPGSTPHYWIEDVNVTSAPSLHMLAAAKTSSIANKKLLLMGDAVSPNADYPQLPMARAEMQKIGKHFAPADATVFERQAATSSAYLRSRLREYAYIHFVAHGVASRTDPLDSAIILSRTGAAEDSFKLHAREILQHPIDARLVTISACYGGGTRSFAGEGLVGLSWAFLRAGAHNVIGALWEASDDSTPQLMDKMYAGLADGMSPSAALRQAKLAMLHSEGKFQQPFYWAPFQMYAGL
jgi:CHAT domain-containing protein